MTREQVLKRCYAARTLEAIQQAWRIRSEWLVQHPDDQAVDQIGEMLAMMEEGLQLAAAGKTPTVAAKAP